MKCIAFGIRVVHRDRLMNETCHTMCVSFKRKLDLPVGSTTDIN